MDVDKFPEGLQVLGVDDNRASLLLLMRQLKFCNYNKVTTVTNTTTALDMLRERKGRDDQFDLVISDIFMVDGIDGFKLLEHISLEMDIPVILISASDEKELMVKGVKHGACDYLVKPACLEQLRNIWMHVVRKSVQNGQMNKISGSNDAAGPKLQSGDGENSEKDGANHTRKHSEKNKKDGNGAKEDKDGMSTQKKQRIQWSGELHHKFLEAIDQIGLDKAVPKKILEVMNVDGLTRDCIASHLQKYRIYLKQFNDGTFKHSNPFMEKLQARLSGGIRANGNTCVSVESSQHQKELGIHEQPSPLFGVSSSGNPFARMNSPFAVGTHSVQPTQSSGYSSGSSTNVSNIVVFNTSSCATSGSSCASISNDGSLLGTRMHFPLSCSCTSYASILRGKMLEANRGIPFDADNFFEEIANGEMSAPSSHLPLQSPEFANQPSVHTRSSSAGQFNQVAPSHHLPLQSPELVNHPSIQIPPSSVSLFNPVAREPHQLAGLLNSSSSWRNGVPQGFPDIGHIAGKFIGPTHTNSTMINQISGLAASSSQVPTFRNEYQNQMAGLMGTSAPMVCLSDQVAETQFNSGSSASSTVVPTGNSTLGRSSSTTFSSLQIGNPVMPTQMPNGGYLHEGGTVDQQFVGDQVNNINELPAGTSESRNGTISDMHDFHVDWDFF